MTFFAIRRRPDAISNRIGKASGYGDCYRCHDSWKWKETHTTWWSDDTGSFPLCEECWSALTPEQRLPFYAQLMADWCSGSSKGSFDISGEEIVLLLDRWPKMKAGVLAGK